MSLVQGHGGSAPQRQVRGRKDEADAASRVLTDEAWHGADGADARAFEDMDDALSSEQHEGVQSRLVMLVAISLSAIVLQKLAEESKGRLQQKSDQLKAGSNARTKLFNSLSHGTLAQAPNHHS